LPTTELLKNADRFHMAELMWRVALPLMALLLMVLAIPLSFANPRGGRSGNLLIALFLFVVYSNSVSIFQAAVKQNRMPVLLAWWPVHLVVVAIVLMLFLWRMKMNSSYHPLVMWGAFKRGFIARRTA
jgi:lipopolysaccharide export system permease protein